MSKQECPTCNHIVDEAYEQYRKEYKQKWYQNNKTKQNFVKWIRANYYFQEVPDVYELYKIYGGAKTKRVLIKRLYCS
ncbi:hypothetical protein [Halomonas saccharevitans]|uniref:Uncharacterized protein n=1 Tax=Halomonas saccharevitans TaxID=416872 RepID=A0A1I7D0F6_9GAMM|nr:hypothetical protein [Halomonas saccharevitans]SFU05143.1 hypothetical protein SAMN04487956_1851 [Halomonas saccharevitans]